jgi:hypothetical protein
MVKANFGPIAALTVGALALAWAAPAVGFERVQPQPSSVEPGLEVTYYSKAFNRLREIPDWAKYKEGAVGPVILAINYDSGSGTVLTSTLDDGVGAHIVGLINLSESGTYEFKVRSNDGAQVTIGGERVVKDDRPHPTRFSKTASVNVAEPGWYAIDVLYFEKRGTSVLELHWSPPWGGGFAIVPAEAFGH